VIFEPFTKKKTCRDEARSCLKAIKFKVILDDSSDSANLLFRDQDYKRDRN